MMIAGDGMNNPNDGRPFSSYLEERKFMVACPDDYVEEKEEKKFDVVEFEKMVEEAKKKKTPKASNTAAAANTINGAAANGRRKETPVEVPTKGGPVDDDHHRHVDRIPDMTGKIITVSAEETEQLTKDIAKKKKKKNRRDRSGGSVGSGRSGGSCKKESSGGKLDGSDKVTEHEFNDFIAKLANQKGIGGQPLDTDCPANNEKFPEEEGGDTPRHQNNRKSLFAPDESDKPQSILPNLPLQQGLLDESQQRKSSYISEYQTVNSTNATNNNNRRQSEQTVDYTIDTWSKTEDQEVGTTLSTRRQSSFLFDLEGTSTTTGMISESIAEEGCTTSYAADYKEGGEGETSSEFDYRHTPASGENGHQENNEGGDKSTNTTRTDINQHYYPQRTRRAPSHRQFQSLRSSLRRSSIDENDKPSTPKPDSISWASLIHMESERSITKKTKKTDKKSSSTRSPSSSSRRHHNTNMLSKKYGESSCSSLELSHATPDSSRVSSIKSRQTRNSLGSNKSKKSNVSWKDESTMTTTFYTKDEAHIASQAIERFERGVYYASKKMYTAARERFLMALRYRVKYYGEPNHVQCAAVHEMLGCVHLCLSREVMMTVVGGSTDEEDVDDEFDIYLPKLGNGRTDNASSIHDLKEDSMMMLSGWDMTLENEDKEVKRRKGRLYLEKAAMHFRTVLDMLKVMADDTGTNPKQTPSSVDSGTRGSVGDIKWFELAKTYEGLDDGHDNASEDALKEIVSRVRSRLDLFPAIMTSGKSYASTFLES